MRRLGSHDPIMRDIERARKAGRFDDDHEPSELLRTPVLELLKRVELMSDARRRSYLASISSMPDSGNRLSPRREGGRKKRRWLSRDG